VTSIVISSMVRSLLLLSRQSWDEVSVLHLHDPNPVLFFSHSKNRLGRNFPRTVLDLILIHIMPEINTPIIIIVYIFYVHACILWKILHSDDI
jgi:hypothetical protein